MKKNLISVRPDIKDEVKGIRLGLVTLLFCLSSGFAFSQLKVVSNGNVGIDANSPLSRFSIGGDGSASSKMYILNSNTSSPQCGLNVQQALTSGVGWSRGIISQVLSGSSTAMTAAVSGVSYKSTPYTSGRTTGVYGEAGNATSGWNYGVLGEIAGSNYGAAIMGLTPGKGQTYVNRIYAGYFRGKVYVEDNVGIGLTNPAYKLEVNGDMNALGYVRSNGVILTSDSYEENGHSGLGKWQPV